VKRIGKWREEIDNFNENSNISIFTE